MDVQISAGKFKGKKLRIPDDSTDFRPTKQKVREALCSSLQMEIPGAKVLELCAGSGVLSLELISRGASHATICELSQPRIQLIKKHAEQLNCLNQTTLISGDITESIKRISDQFDIIFFDPPYYQNELTDLIAEVAEFCKPGGVLIFEYGSDDSYARDFPVPTGFSDRIKKYGLSSIRYFRKEE